ncbi:MAG TPA: hypothetical protein DEQ02_05680 [Ruminococcaceae bacterium]|nr:hypothetical protein [Oscillospiraceae bacterium]
MSKYAYARKRGHKPLAALVAVILVTAALIGGAMAWIDFTQSRTNKFRGTYDADVTLHDEFDGLNKDVFVENSGTNPIYVRVRLDEYMQVGDKIFTMSGGPEPNVRDKNTWIPHTYTGTDISDCEQTDTADKFHDYYVWSMSGMERDYTPGTPGMVYSTLGSDGMVDRTDTGGSPTPHHTAPMCVPMKLSQYMLLLSGELAGTLTPEEQQRLNAAKAGCWLADDTDTAANGGAWAYWSTALEPDTATNLLLDKVTLKKDAEDDWIYRIDVKLQAVTLTDTVKWDENGWLSTAAAKSLFETWNAA